MKTDRVARCRLQRRAFGLAEVALLAAVFLLPRAVNAQRMGRYFGDPNAFYTPPDFHGNPPYDGRFVFARIKYRGFEHFTREGPGWSHDYPDAEEHLMLIMRDVTGLRPFVRAGDVAGGAIVALDDPELFKYPVAYLSEPGGWHPNEAEVRGMHNYLHKGGFVIFDDFGGYDWQNFTTQMQRVLPGLRPIALTGNEPIFDSFFKIDVKLVEQQCMRDFRACYRGIFKYYAFFQDNNPKKRMLAMATYDADIGEFWQWSGTGFAIVDLSNEAYKLGVNYFIYALTH